MRRRRRRRRKMREFKIGVTWKRRGKEKGAELSQKKMKGARYNWRENNR